MLQFIFFICILTASTQYVDGLVCTNQCEFSGHISNLTLPTCATIDKPADEQNCQVVLFIDHVSGSVSGRLNPRTPSLSYTLDIVTIFSLFYESVNLTMEFDCKTNDNCDQEFIKEIIRSDWTKVQNEVKILRRNLVDILFNSSDLIPHDTCLPNEKCSDEGFCSVVYQSWSDTRPTFASECTNTTEFPLLQWIQAYEQSRTGEIMQYTCNEPSCGSQAVVDSVVLLIKTNYILPINITIPPITTTASTVPPTTGITTEPTAVITTENTHPPVTTTTNNGVKPVHSNEIEKIIFSLFSILILIAF